MVKGRFELLESARMLDVFGMERNRSASMGMSARKEIPPSVFGKQRKMISASNPRTRLACLFVTGLLPMIFLAQPARAQMYAGALGGISTLSGDTRVIINSTSTNFSTYNPNNGPALNALLGKHLTDIFAVQGDYVWNRNSLDFTEGAFDSGSPSAYEETHHSSQQSLFGSVLVYFRNRKSWIRPYLSIGTGWVHLSSIRAIGNFCAKLTLPASEFIQCKHDRPSCACRRGYKDSRWLADSIYV